MSPNLERELHDAVDAGPADNPFDVDVLTRRISHQRRLRAGARAGVALGVVAVVAVGASLVVQNRATTAGPAGAPGTCGSSVADLPQPAQPPVAISRDVQEIYGNSPADLPQANGGLGQAGAGSALDVQVLSVLSDEDIAAMPQSAVDALQASLTDAQAALAAAQAATPVREHAVEDLQATVDGIAYTVAHVDEVRTADPTGVLHTPARVLVVRDGVVVATDPVPPADATRTLLDFGPAESSPMALPLTACDADGGALPAGVYDVYVTYLDPAGTLSAAGPWSLTLR